MTLALPAILAEVGKPLFGSMPLALTVVLAGIAVFTFAVAGFGRWLAATHPDPVAKGSTAAGATAVPAATTAAVPVEVVPEELTAVISAAVYATLGDQGKVVSVKPIQVSVEALMQQWSLEGRRQIYSSHKVR